MFTKLAGPLTQIDYGDHLASMIFRRRAGLVCSNRLGGWPEAARVATLRCAIALLVPLELLISKRYVAIVHAQPAVIPGPGAKSSTALH